MEHVLEVAKLEDGGPGCGEKNANSFLACLCLWVRWVEDVCVRKVGSRKREVVGGRACGRSRCTRV